MGTASTSAKRPLPEQQVAGLPARGRGNLHRDGRRSMKIERQIIVFDAADLATESAFWAGVLDGRVVVDDNWHSVVDADGEWRIGVQLAPDHVPPDWPHGAPQQVHLDLH